jgi:hypothetical protein
MGEPMHVYPDPNGGDNSTNYAPSDTRLAGAAIVSGGVAVGAAATGSGTAAMIQQFLFFFQGRVPGGNPVEYMGAHAADARHVAIFLFFASLSVVLQVINLVKGLKMKRDLAALSARVNATCKSGPPAAPTIFEWWKSAPK